MDIILQGQYTDQEIVENLRKVLQLFKERYHVTHFREVHLVMTLMDNNDEDVELVDTETSEVYRSFEVYRSDEDLKSKKKGPSLKLIVDNTR